MPAVEPAWLSVSWMANTTITARTTIIPAISAATASRRFTFRSSRPRAKDGVLAEVLFDAKSIEQTLVGAPVAPNAHGELQVDLGSQLALYRSPGSDPD